jgi:hypothetical protein
MPFHGLSTQDVIRAQIEDQIQHPREINPKLSLACAQVITRLMMKVPAQRYADWKSVMADFQRILDGSPVPMKTLTGGESTIAARRDTRPKLQKSAGGTDATAGAANNGAAPLARPDGAVTSGWMKHPPVAMLTIFLAWLFYALLWVPWRDSRVPEKPAVPLPVPPTAIRHPVAPPVPSAPEPRNRRPNPIPDSIPEAPVQTPDITTAPRPGNPPPDTEGQQLLGILKNSIVHMAASSGFEAATTLFEQQRQEPALAGVQAQLDELVRFMAPPNRPHNLIAAQFRQRIGQDASIKVGNRRVDFRVEAVNAGVVHTIVKTSPSSNTADYPAELKISALEPAEQRRWIGSTNTPETAFSAAILDLTAENYAAALALAGACGPFADAIRQFAEKRLPDKVE